MRARWRKFLYAYSRSPLLPLTAAVMALVGLLIALPSGPDCAKVASAANGQLPSDYCYLVPISFTLSSSATSTLTDVAVRIPSSEGFNASGLIGSNLMDDQAWDAHPATSGFQETDLFGQDLTSSTAPWWFGIPSASAGQTVVINLYFGSDIQRDQGFLFTGGDSISVAHHADFNIADSLTLSVGVEMLSTAVQAATLASHRNGSAGYSLSLVDSSGLAIRGQADGVTCDLAWPTGNIPADESAYIDFTFTSGTSTITIWGSDGTQEGTNSCTTGLASISATTTAFTVGGSLNRAIVRDVRLLSGSSVMLHWGMNPSALTETGNANPTYTGTVTDESPQGHNGTYTMSRDQTNWTVDIGAVRLVSAGGAIPPTPVTSVNLLGSNQFGINLDITATPASGDTFQNIFGATVREYITQGGNRNLAWTAFFVTAALGFILIAWTAFRYIPLAILFGGVPLVYGLTRGFVPGFVVVIWAAFVIVAWFAVRRGEAPG